MATSDYLLIVLAAVGLIVGALAVVLSLAYRQRGLVEVTNETLWKRAKAEIDLMAARLDIQNMRLELVESQLEEFKRGTRILINQLLDLKAEPKWSPPETPLLAAKPKRDPAAPDSWRAIHHRGTGDAGARHRVEPGERRRRDRNGCCPSASGSSAAQQRGEPVGRTGQAGPSRRVHKRKWIRTSVTS